MSDAALVLAAVVCCGAVVLACRARVSAANQLLAENRAAVERERVEWRLDRAALVEEALSREALWRTERRELLNRIQAPEIAVGAAFAEADAEARTQAKGEPRPVRPVNYRSEDAEARLEHLEQAREQLHRLGLGLEDVAQGAVAHRGGHDS